MLLGAFAEWATGMGTAFGLGMYLPTPYTLPMLIGGGLRDRWEDKSLKPVVEEVREKEGSAKAEQKRALMLLMTFMVAAGALTGEAFFGVEAAMFAVADELTVEETYTEETWTDGYLDDLILGEHEDGEANWSAAVAWAESQNAANPDEPICSSISDESITCTVPMQVLSWYPMARLAGFVLANILLAAGVVALFARAGVISFSGKDNDVMDADIVE